jgi:nitroimidazol reductase NimA-like FMN-containing flavoprotein (pyridoxamine 5'-phosphate oxidase superfamily)
MSESFGTIETLDPRRCVALLGTVGVGRVVFTNRAMPAVRPVCFAVRDDAVWFRMAAGDMMLACVLDTVVAFAADNVTGDLDAGWFVTVVGRASEVRDKRLVREIAPLLPAVGHPQDERYVRVLVESVSGSRIRPPASQCAEDCR